MFLFVYIDHYAQKKQKLCGYPSFIVDWGSLTSKINYSLRNLSCLFCLRPKHDLLVGGRTRRAIPFKHVFSLYYSLYVFRLKMTS